MQVIAVISANMLTANTLLFVFLSGQFPGALSCPVWSNLFMKTPQKMEALEGSCLQIPCYFWARYRDNFDGSETFGVWIKSDPELEIDQNTVIFNSSGSVNTYPMKIIGNLKQKKCTTLFTRVHRSYTSQYLFRVEKWPFRETALCDPLQLTVKDSPQRPRIEISGDLKEGESVTITCSALTPCPRLPPKLTWNLQKDSHNNMEENTDGTFTTKIQEDITLSDQHDGYNITCSATYPVNEGKDDKTAEETKTLRVSSKPPVSSRPMNVSKGEFYSINETQLTEDYPDLRVIVHITVKILGVVSLYGAFFIFECCIQSRCCNKPGNRRVKNSLELQHVDRVIEI